MQALFDFGQRDDVRGLVQRVLEYPHVQGVVVDYDALWLQLWRLRSLHGESAVSDVVRRFFDWFHYGPFGRRGFSWICLEEVFAFHHDSSFELADIETPNPKWRPPGWGELRHITGYPTGGEDPFVVKICLLPWSVNEAVIETGEHAFGVVQERRTPAYFTMPLRAHRPVVGGVSIGTTARDAGTLGGIVEDQNGQRWGVSCAHVVQVKAGVEQPAQRDGGAPGPIAVGLHVSSLSASIQSTPCNPYNTGSVMNSVDAALVQFNPPTTADLEVLNLGKLAGITPKGAVNPGASVEIAGKQSGTRILQVGGLGLTYRLRDENRNLYCFEHLFELRWPRFWRNIAGRPVQRGDSGAWALVSTARGNEWAGMAIAGDRLIGYAVFAETVVKWANDKHALSLKVV